MEALKQYQWKAAHEILKKKVSDTKSFQYSSAFFSLSFKNCFFFSLFVIILKKLLLAVLMCRLI